MNLNEKNPIINTPTVMFTKMKNTNDDINNRMEKRNYSDTPLNPNYNPRPISTKYTHLQVYQGRKPAHETLLKYPEFETQNNFYPGSQDAPFAGYSNNVDLETILRNQTSKLQHGAEQAAYIPSSNSDLYRTQMAIESQPMQQPHPNLFKQEKYAPTNNNFHPNIGQDMLFNHTRTQLRNT